MQSNNYFCHSDPEYVEEEESQKFMRSFICLRQIQDDTREL